MKINFSFGFLRILAVAAFVAFISACAGTTPNASAPVTMPSEANAYNYVIGPGDQLQLFVWKSPELSTSTTVRPDGKISIPLVEDIQAAGKTPTALASEIKARLVDYVRDPIVTVIPTLFVGPYDHQIRVIGEAVKPRSFAYRENMTVLDVIVEVGGLTNFAAGNRAVIVRTISGQRQTLSVKLDDLVRDGNVAANVPMVAGDILIIPESWF